MGRAGVDSRIHTAALEILRSRGPAAVSVESVAAASGVAKTTIYRRYDNREVLLAAAVESATRPISVPDDLQARDTIRWVLQHARDRIDVVIGRGTLAAIVSGDEPHLTALLLGLVRASLDPLRAKLHEHVDRGELRADLDVELAITVIMGAVISEVIRGRATDDAWVEKVLVLLWPGLAPAPAEGQ